MVTFTGTERRPNLGIGTWRMGERERSRASEIASIRAAIGLGMCVIDTAEMYADGAAEEVTGAAIAESLRAGDTTREKLFLVGKVYPHNAGASAMRSACERSLGRLGVDTIDCYLLHWRGSIPLEETVAAFNELHRLGRIRFWGVSNFDLDDMRELIRVPGGAACAVNQMYLSLSQRAPQFSLLPWLQLQGMVTMAYSPLDQGALSRNAALRTIADRLQATPSQLALAWLMAQPQVMAIAKASNIAHVAENAAASQLSLTSKDFDDIDHAFPPPTVKRPLAML